MKWFHVIIKLVVLSSLSFAMPAYANDIAAVHTLIQSGDYTAAHDTAVEIQTADAFALAAESLARQVMLGEVEKLKKTSKTARKLAEDALAIDPNHQNARLQYVITDGFVARLTSNVSAWMKKLPQKSFEKIQAYRSDFPDDARGDALLAAWHLAIVRKAGEDNAMKWFEASISEGQRLYKAALLESPDDPVIALNYAFALIALEEEDFSDYERVNNILVSVINMTGEDDLSRKIIGHAQKALTLFKDKADLKSYAEGFLDGEQST